ncbi:acyl-CoA synthetase MbcS [Staphylococcus xylosus]|uniref:acyl-CoA synthetase MbcS n=1 Tax=Staphylococcus xylosus TaxID=1288 RepID=UPI000416CDBD|nr:AMP-binding protein [Staphylococcus xylosus]ARD75945.1 acyl--CoA ligase [Staphylococcus xylosus]MBF0811150.1 AMP-binding protein [Staphylococcus xylosus]MBU6133044.1 AMP-binding protein [Staphylococcus xylosus]MCD8851240.1 AMP-binding protein [Staphylococcus xylosus]MDG5479608.1 AMP-binding protein [Staphylococcus xylosus]
MNKKDLVAPDTYNIVSEIEKYIADENKKAIIFENAEGETHSITYNQLVKNANQVGNMFLKHGLQKGDKVLVMMPRSIETYEIYIAALKLGIVVIPSSEMLRTKDLQYRISHGEVKAIVVTADSIDEFKAVKEYNTLTKFIVGGEYEDWYTVDSESAKETDELQIVETSKDDVALLSYTSGTTGNPKAVVHSHGWGYAHMQMAPKHWLSIKEDDIAWATAAPGWQKWVWSPFLSIMGSGATAFVYNGKFNAEKYLELLQDYKINVLCCTPTEYRLMAKLPNLTDYNLEHLHSAVSAGEPLNREVVEKFQTNFDLTVRDGYGQTESTLLIGFLKDTESRPGSMGKAIPGSHVTVINDDGELAEIGEVGNIAVPLDLPALFKGYYKDPERTAEPRIGDYYITGDLAKLDEDGYFWFEGRKDDIIISSGYTIGPFEVEDSLTKHEYVKECAVVASPHEIRGNIVKAFIILQEGVSATDDTVKTLQDYVKQDVAPYKYPRAIEFVEDLPKTNSGKIRRIELREAEKNK